MIRSLRWKERISLLTCFRQTLCAIRLFSRARWQTVQLLLGQPHKISAHITRINKTRLLKITACCYPFMISFSSLGLLLVLGSLSAYSCLHMRKREREGEGLLHRYASITQNSTSNDKRGFRKNCQLRPVISVVRFPPRRRTRCSSEGNYIFTETHLYWPFDGPSFGDALRAHECWKPKWGHDYNDTRHRICQVDNAASVQERNSALAARHLCPTNKGRVRSAAATTERCRSQHNPPRLWRWFWFPLSPSVPPWAEWKRQVPSALFQPSLFSFGAQSLE